MSNNQKGNLMNKEDIISMFLGLAIVGVVMLVLINYFKTRSGRIDLDGITDVSLVENSSLESGEKEIDESGDQAEMVVSSDGTYEVIKGDSLWKIAQKRYNNGYKWVEIAKQNNLDENGANNLEVGQKLNLPDLQSPDLPTEHVVVSGESLSKLALNYYGDMFAWEKIWNANKTLITDPNLIDIGMKLVIPE